MFLFLGQHNPVSTFGLAKSIGMLHVLRWRDPFKIDRGVVRRVPVDVIDLRTQKRSVVLDERESDQAMKKLGPAQRTFPYVDEPIAPCGGFARF